MGQRNRSGFLHDDLDLSVSHVSKPRCERMEIGQRRGQADDLDMVVSGGSDFHGDNRPGVSLGVGRGNLNVSDNVLEALYEYRTRKGI